MEIVDRQGKADDFMKRVEELLASDHPEAAKKPFREFMGKLGCSRGYDRIDYVYRIQFGEEYNISMPCCCCCDEYVEKVVCFDYGEHFYLCFDCVKKAAKVVE